MSEVNVFQRSRSNLWSCLAKAPQPLRDKDNAVDIFVFIRFFISSMQIKEVAPDKAFPDTKRFWKEDIKTVRDYNRTISGNEARDTTTVLNRFVFLLYIRGLQIFLYITSFFFFCRILDEWEMHGFNDGANTVNSEGRRSQLQHNMVLERYMSEIENDPVYRTVRHWAGYPAEVWIMKSLVFRNIVKCVGTFFDILII